MRRAMAIVGCVAGLALAAPAAGADGGGPFTPYLGGYGASAPGGTSVYITLPQRDGTLVERFDRRAGAVLDWRTIRGSYGVPAAAGDGSTTGLSADGHRLVLAEVPRTIPPKRTRLVLLTGGLHVIKRITLPGAFSVDAISPDGRWLYLIHYSSPRRNILRYEVRAYDLPAGRLLAKPVIDPREPDEDMRGTAVTRVMSHDGRWAYTLYSRPKGAPFVHALDTERRTAACIDLGGVSPEALLTLGLSRDGGTLTVRSLDLTRDGEPTPATEVGPVARIDTRTFAVSPPSPARPHAPRARPDHPRADNGAPAWPAAVIGIALVAGLVALRRRRRTAPV
jgi:hypothetical protein